MSKVFWAAFVGMALSGAALILLLPSLFEPHGSRQELIAGSLGTVFVVLAVVVLTLRASSRRSPKPHTDK